MSENLPWPMGLRCDIRDGETPDEAVAALALENTLLWLTGDEYFHIHEIRRHTPPRNQTVDAKAILHLASETVDRYGADYARQVVHAAMRGDLRDRDHSMLLTNVFMRWGRTGLLYFAGYLELQYCAEQLRMRAERDA